MPALDHGRRRADTWYASNSSRITPGGGHLLPVCHDARAFTLRAPVRTAVRPVAAALWPRRGDRRAGPGFCAVPALIPGRRFRSLKIYVRRHHKLARAPRWPGLSTGADKYPDSAIFNISIDNNFR
jgi:hypothetical protein